MSETKFNPNDHLTNMKGKMYLEVKWRLVWFRQEHPNGSIHTEVVSTSPVILKATIYDADGNMLASGHGSANEPENGRAVWSGRSIEKAETAAIGRALGHAGFGTQFTEDDEGDHLADSPVERQQQRPTPPPARQEAPATPKGTNGKQQHIWTIQGYSFTELMTATAFIIENNQHRANTIWKLHDTGELERTTLVQATEAVRAYANQGRVTMS